MATKVVTWAQRLARIQPEIDIVRRRIWGQLEFPVQEGQLDHGKLFRQPLKGPEQVAYYPQHGPVARSSRLMARFARTHGHFNDAEDQIRTEIKEERVRRKGHAPKKGEGKRSKKKR
eukprot:Clim_evm55s172 gene=Clim_evmTU55s172